MALFGDIVIRPGGQTDDLIRERSLLGQHDDRDPACIAVLFQTAADISAVYVRQQTIEQNNVRILPLDDFKQRQSVFYNNDLMSDLLQKTFQ
jgi:hypothetical protein